MNSEFWLSIVGGVIGIIITYLLLAHRLKHDKELAKIVKSINKYGVIAFFIATLITITWFFIIGFIDEMGLFKNIDSTSFLGKIIVSVGIFSFPAIFFCSWGILSKILKNKFKK